MSLLSEISLQAPSLSGWLSVDTATDQGIYVETGILAAHASRHPCRAHQFQPKRAVFPHVSTSERFPILLGLAFKNVLSVDALIGQVRASFLLKGFEVGLQGEVL
jgi:hypothetical protein